MAIQFYPNALPSPGTVISFRKEGQEVQRFNLTRARPHTCRDGTSSGVLSWTTRCKDCDKRFLFRCGLSTRAFVRRCPECRKADPHIMTGWPSGPKMRHVLLSEEEARPQATMEAASDIDPDSLF